MSERGETHQPNSDEDDLWRQIVENYGEVPSFEEPQLPVDPTPAPPQVAATEPDEPDWFHADSDDVGGYVPEVPALPRPKAGVLAAWLGVIGSPMVLLALLFTRVPTPVWVNWGLVIAFVGGFGYLVSRMPKQRDDPWDDGARV